MVGLTAGDFSVDEVVKRMRQPKVGAISIYVGTVREFPEEAGLEFDNDSQAIQKLAEIEERALEKFDVEDIAIVHRVGCLGVSENILLVAVSASHRGPAFEACRSIIEDIKGLHKSWAKEIPKRKP